MVAFAFVAAASAAIRASRLAMGTVVGITVVAEPAEAEVAIEAAYAAIEAGEAELSEWRPESVTSRLVATGGPLALSPEADELYTFCLDLNARTRGAFDILWRGPGVLGRGAEGWTVTGPIDLGGVLKGWLVDRAGAALRSHGIEDFLVDAAGDLLAAGNADTGRGWPVEVWSERGRVARVRLRDQALSTSGNAGQPGHIRDGRDGRKLVGARVVSVVAPRGMVADGLATALYAGGELAVATERGAFALDVAAEGRKRWSEGARRVFR